MGKIPGTAEDIILKHQLLDLIYPIGTYYWSSNQTDPGELFGGIWESVQDKFILAAGPNFPAGLTGGESEHVLTKEELPNIKGQLQFRQADNTNIVDLYNESSNSPFSIQKLGGNSWSYQLTKAANSNNYKNDVITFDLGGQDMAHNNMPPYETAYCWKRKG